MRCRRRLAALARDHIMKLREERQRMAYGWLEEYRRASSAKLKGDDLSSLHAEYVHRYNQLLDLEKQPHSDFFINLSLDIEDELDFDEEAPFDLTGYDQYFEWDEAEYMKLRFIAARHYASRGHWDDAYAYILRSRPDDIPQHEDTYNRNAQALHYTYVRIYEIIQEAEQALAAGDRRLTQGVRFGPPRDSLIPPAHSTGAPSPVRSIQGGGRGFKGLPGAMPTNVVGRSREQEGRFVPKSPLTPDRKFQREERDSVIDAVKQITGAPKEVPSQERVSIGGTPEYDWDTRYDGIIGSTSHLKNRVSEPSTPQGEQSPGGPQTPPEPQRHYKQLKVYDETPSGRPLPTLQQIRQANL